MVVRCLEAEENHHCPILARAGYMNWRPFSAQETSGEERTVTPSLICGAGQEWGNHSNLRPPRLTLDLLWPREKVRAPSIIPPTGKLHSGRRTPISWEMAPRERTLGLVWERIQGRLTASAGRKHKQPSKELKSSLPYRWGQ